MIKMGGSVACPKSAGKSRYVQIDFEDEEEYASLCNFGIFTCDCSNIKVSRVTNDYSSNRIQGFTDGQDREGA